MYCAVRKHNLNVYFFRYMQFVTVTTCASEMHMYILAWCMSLEPCMIDYIQIPLTHPPSTLGSYSGSRLWKREGGPGGGGGGGGKTVYANFC